MREAFRPGKTRRRSGKPKETRHTRDIPDAGTGQEGYDHRSGRIGEETPGPEFGVNVNIQIAVDAKHKLIAEQQVHNKVSDLGLLAETAVAARRNLAVDRIDAVADAGYFKIEDIEACENAGVMPHVPKPQRGSTVSQGLFPKERFRYDGGEDIYICPNGQCLALHSKRKRRDLFFASYANRAACKECQLKSKCTRAPSVESCAMSTKRSWSAWQNDWRPARNYSMRAVKASSIPSAQSNNGWARVPS